MNDGVSRTWFNPSIYLERSRYCLPCGIWKWPDCTLDYLQQLLLSGFLALDFNIPNYGTTTLEH